MTTAAQESAAQFLFAARNRGTPGDRIPDAFRPADIDAALAIQQRVNALTGLAVGGWKCSVPSAARAILAAPIYAPTIRRESPCPLPAVGGVAKIEPEVAFLVGRDLPPRGTPYTEQEIRSAIGAAHLVIELIGARYADPASVGFQNCSPTTSPMRASSSVPPSPTPSRDRSSISRSSCVRRRARCTPARASIRTDTRCCRCTGSRTIWPCAATSCGRDRSSPPAPTPACVEVPLATPLTFAVRRSPRVLPGRPRAPASCERGSAAVGVRRGAARSKTGDEPRGARHRRDLARPAAGGQGRLLRLAQPRAHARTRRHPGLSPRPALSS